jgi:NitT/TauT family transport system substrate-binding protein
VTLPTWTGYGPLFLAKEKGFFKKNGIDVDLSIVEGLAERKQSLASGKIDGKTIKMKQTKLWLRV